jgi:hypothetical protein
MSAVVLTGYYATVLKATVVVSWFSSYLGKGKTRMELVQVKFPQS